jgi:membrane protein YdbS with pleckstrin-like domain
MNDEPAGESGPAEGGAAAGDPTDVEGPTVPDQDGAEPAEYTTDVRTLDSRVRLLWIGRAIVIGLVLGGVATAATLSAAPEWVWIGPAVFALVAGLGTAHAILLYRIWSYEVREDSLLLERGVITRVKTVVPYVRVQHIDTSRGPIERVVGISSLVVYTAGSRGADVTIPGLTPDEAADLQARLKVLAIESEGEDAV